jgi:hypothetical protein
LLTTFRSKTGVSRLSFRNSAIVLRILQSSKVAFAYRY